jgi:hypothetical protein
MLSAVADTAGLSGRRPWRRRGQAYLAWLMISTTAREAVSEGAVVEGVAVLLMAGKC